MRRPDGPIGLNAEFTFYCVMIKRRLRSWMDSYAMALLLEQKIKNPKNCTSGVWNLHFLGSNLCQNSLHC